MANREHLAILKKGVTAWNQWRLEHPEVSPDLEGLHRSDLRTSSLREANLNGANLGEAHLPGIDFRHATLAQARLRRARLRWATLSTANLREADLLFADLMGASLEAADLHGANLGGAILRGATLGGANLAGATLSESNLRGTYFRGTNLRGAHVREARMGRTTLVNLDLSEVEGLESVQHDGPSSLGLDTLVLSRGRIPVDFMKAIGMPTSLAENLPGFLARHPQGGPRYHSCFISYSHADQAFAHRLHQRLDEIGIRAWLDERELLPGSDIAESLHSGIEASDRVLLCCSATSLESWWVDQEIKKALEKERRAWDSEGIRARTLIPLNLDGELFRSESAVASDLRGRLAADFTGWVDDEERFEQQLQRVVEALKLGPDA